MVIKKKNIFSSYKLSTPILIPVSIRSKVAEAVSVEIEECEHSVISTECLVRLWIL